MRAYLGSDSAYRTYSTTSRKPKPMGRTLNRLDTQVIEECPELPPLLPCGAMGVAEWTGVCEFLGVDVPSSVLSGVSNSNAGGGQSGKCEILHYGDLSYFNSHMLLLFSPEPDVM